MSNDTKARVHQFTSVTGQAVAALRFEGDIASTSIFGLSKHFTKVFTMVGITKYSQIFPNESEALAAL